MLFKEKAYYLLIGFLCFILYPVSGQDQKIADSLKKIYQQEIPEDSVKLELLRNLAFNEANDLKLALQYAEELISLSKQLGNNLYLHRGYFQKGNVKRLMGDPEEALDAYFKSGEAARKTNYIKGEGNTYGAIADIYSVSKNHKNAMLYYHKAISTLRKSNDPIFLASAISNAGNEFLNHKIYDSAFFYFEESGKIFEKANYLIGMAYNLGNIGMVYANQGKSGLAEKNINEAIRILEEAQDYYPICVYLISMCDIYLEKGDNKAAMNYAKRSLQLAEQYKLKEQISDANLKLYELYEKAGNTKESFKYYKNHIAYRDSVNDIKSVQKMADLRTDYEVSQKQIEVDLLNQKRRNQRNLLISLAAILGLITLLLGTLYWYFKVISREKKRSENLLLNILPAETAKELKQNGKVEAVKFDEVTVLFTDFVSFSKLAEHIPPEQLVKSIDFYFKGFDEITSKYGLEKIKTIGDSYMCAGGLPSADKSHAGNVMKAAKEMIELVKNAMNATDGLTHFDIRIGAHTGPVIAGIVGIKKWQYDIWGDTVNIASRMESKSEPGRINISETTYHKIKDEFACIYRGEIEVKNRGILKMYFLS
ncbi:MAG: adenylate/guanylate cyclase domain-containing protein [Chitinophagaceae bacterium]|nr:adenylate/guanylate cyclase domain-containing protein [Chitinophagaceae bacterium]